MIRFVRSGTLVALVFTAGLMLSGCSESQLKGVKVEQNADGSVTVTILPAPGEKGTPRTVLVPANAIPPSLRARLPPKKPAPPTVRPGNGGKPGGEPTVPARPKPPAPPPTTVTNPNKPPVQSGSPTDRNRIEADFGVAILGKDANNPEYLSVLRQSLELYPAGSMRGLQVYLDQQPLSRTGGVGGTWQMQGGRAWITLYQAGLSYVHVTVHELAHHLDLFVNRGQPTPDLMNAARVNGTIPQQNIPSAYAKYGLENPQHNPEWAAEVISWSLDRRGVPGFQANAWRPTQPLVDRLGKYVEKGKIVWNNGR